MSIIAKTKDLAEAVGLVKSSAGRAVGIARKVATAEAEAVQAQEARRAKDNTRPAIEAKVRAEVEKLAAEFTNGCRNAGRLFGGSVERDGAGFVERRGAGLDGLLMELAALGGGSAWHLAAAMDPEKLIAAIMRGSDAGASYGDAFPERIRALLAADAEIADLRQQHRDLVAAMSEAGVTVAPLEANAHADRQTERQVARMQAEHQEHERAFRRQIAGKMADEEQRVLAEKIAKVRQLFPRGGYSFRTEDVDRILSGELIPDGAVRKEG
jgi:hypothetical protein